MLCLQEHWLADAQLQYLD